MYSRTGITKTSIHSETIFYYMTDTGDRKSCTNYIVDGLVGFKLSSRHILLKSRDSCTNVLNVGTSIKAKSTCCYLFVYTGIRYFKLSLPEIRA